MYLSIYLSIHLSINPSTYYPLLRPRTPLRAVPLLAALSWRCAPTAGCNAYIRRTAEGILSGALRCATAWPLATHCAPAKLPRRTSYLQCPSACTIPATLHHFPVASVTAADSLAVAPLRGPCSAARCNYLSIYLSVCLSVYLCLSIYLSIFQIENEALLRDFLIFRT